MDSLGKILKFETFYRTGSSLDPKWFIYAIEDRPGESQHFRFELKLETAVSNPWISSFLIECFKAKKLRILSRSHSL